ncbi:MAG TPA: 4-(cytidine 5'-diphospho)-2-C-methyl-D-erythritol kinase [Chthoniobacteraceae bacterium]|jgi:4-diphosphocytidyl-2-C-methyl-D-erythritol kinase
MSERVELLAPAKINLTLEVKGRREDGFHEIESLVAPISLFDTLEFARSDRDGLSFSCDDPSLPTGDDNLVVKAAKLFCQRFHVPPNLRIDLRKKIPHGAGLGGGSSNAAATLLGLNQLFEKALSREALCECAAQLGSDVPLFVFQSAALIRGRGERVEQVDFPHALPLLLIKPSFGVPTPWAYSRWRDSREIPGVPYARQEFSWGTLVNDLERPVFEKYLFLADLKSWLLVQPEAEGALMSGSGSTVFAVLRSKEQGAALLDRLRQEFGPDLWTCFCEVLTGPTEK